MCGTNYQEQYRSNSRSYATAAHIWDSGTAASVVIDDIAIQQLLSSITVDEILFLT